MTGAEVAARQRGETPDIARRIARHSPTKPVGRLVSDKPAPPRISTAEMEEIQRATGRLPSALRERLRKPAESDVAPDADPERKPSPAKEPPGESSS